MLRSLADGHTKFTILTAAPADPENPTAAELNAGIDMSPKLLANDFRWTATDSDKVDEKSLVDDANAKALGASNYDVSMTIWRYWLAAGGADPAADEGYAATKTKGTELYGYARETAKKATEPWAADDEVYLGGRFVTDTPQRPDGGGWIKRKVPCEMQEAWDDIKVAAGV
jgi:hypothetical protein